MKWKIILFWMFVFIILFLFLQSFSVYMYLQQEEMQLFIPHWWFVGKELLTVGGTCRVAGMYAIQFYRNPLFAVLLNDLLLCGCGIFCYLILQRFASRGYHLLLSLLPVFGLLKIHLDPDYAIEGTFALLLILALLLGFTAIRSRQARALYIGTSTIIVCLLAGQAALLYGVPLLVFFLAGYFIGRIAWEGKGRKIAITCSLALLTFGFAGTCLPDTYDVQNRMLTQLSSLARQQNWEAIIRIHQGKKITSDINRNYLNMALAQKGELGNTLFCYDQKGPQGLLAPWNGTYFMSVLLSDIHFYLGDISTSEGYAMEGLALAKRQGSPRMLQRLVQINLMKGELPLAEKYIHLLSLTHGYRAWTKECRKSVAPLAVAESDNLLCLIETDSLWKMHLAEPIANRTAMEYLGCSYLLAKQMEPFKALLLRLAGDTKWQPLPRHFQEAAAVLAADDPLVLKSVFIQPEMMTGYKDFQQLTTRAKQDKNSIVQLYQQYGNTFWFYYYVKQL